MGGARLESHIDGSSGCARGLGDGFDLSMRASRFPMPAARDYAVMADNYGANGGIGVGETDALFRFREGLAHEGFVHGGHAGSFTRDLQWKRRGRWTFAGV